VGKQELTESNLLEYLFPVYLATFRAVLAGTSQGRNIGKNSTRPSANYLQNVLINLLEKVIKTRKSRGKKSENVYGSVTV
jgi:hypothetical protein